MKFVRIAFMLVLAALMLGVSAGAQEETVECIVNVNSMEIEGFAEHSPRFPEVEFFSSDIANGVAAFIEEKMPSTEVAEENYDSGSGYYYADIVLDEYYTNGGDFDVSDDYQTVLNEIANLLNYNPSLFYVKSVGLREYDRLTGKFPYIRVFTSNCADELEEQKEFYADELEALVEKIPEDFSDYEKVLWLNDYICTNFEYDTSYVIHDVYNFFLTGKGVCESYSKLFVAVMDELDIPADYCTSNVMGHMWNFVKLDENWYHLDITWNDPVSDVYGRDLHTYFLLSDSYVQSTDGGKSEHYSYTELYDCSDTTFDGLGIGFKSAFVELDGKWYTPAFNNTNYKSFLYEMESPYLPEISLDTSVVELGYRHVSPNSNGLWPTCASYAWKFEDYILVNTEDNIYIFDGENSEVIYSPKKDSGYYIYGFALAEDKLCFQFADSPNNLGSAVKATADINTVTYLDSDGTVIAEAYSVGDGDIPSILVPENPQKADDEYYSYTFSAWEQTDDGEFTAVYTKKVLDDVEIIVDESLEYYNKHGGSKIKFSAGQFKHIGHHAFDDDEVTAIILPDDVEDVQQDSFEGVPNAIIYLSRKNQKLHDCLKGFNLMQHRYLEDINFDRLIDINDFKYLVSGIVHGTTASLDSICSDINEDEKIDLKDLRALVRSLAD